MKNKGRITLEMVKELCGEAASESSSNEFCSSLVLTMGKEWLNLSNDYATGFVEGLDGVAFTPLDESQELGYEDGLAINKYLTLLGEGEWTK